MTRKTVPERSGLSATHTRDVFYGYDLRGLQTYARFDSASGEGVTNTYDGFGNRTAETLTMNGVSRTLTAGFNANGRRTSLRYPDGQTLSYTYDQLDRFHAMQLTGTGYLIYTPYYANGTVAAINRLKLSAGDWGYSDTATTYAYDLVLRLSRVTQALAGNSYDTTTTFTRNPASQIASLTRTNDAYAWTGHANVDRNYTTNGLNQYTAAGPASFTYDANGNLTSDGSNTYLYDVENRLVSRSGGGTSATLRYDPLGRLYEVSGSASGITRFLYDGDALVGEYNTSGTLLRRYVHGAAEGVDDPLVWFEGAGVADSARRYLYADERGSIVAVTDGNGNKLAINTYDEYGIPGSGNTGRFQYTGQAWVPELGMYYYKARMYSPTLGRFMQTDPVGYEDQVNLYAYVANDPVNLIDYTGEKIEVAMHEVTVGPYRSGSYHLKIVIVPNDQDAFRNDDRFQVDSNGTVFATIGAGPDSDSNIFGPLVQGMNRETDVGKTLSGESYTVRSITPGQGDTENNLINRMIGVAQSFDNGAYDYSLSPSANGSDYNSNSFVGGLINRLGGESSQLNPSMPTPGLDKPVPSEAFCQPSIDGCR